MNDEKKKEAYLPSKDIILSWYEEAKKHDIISSWRQLAKKAKVNPAILSSWQTEGRLPGDETIYALAAALDKDATPLLQAVIHERSHRTERQLINKYGDLAASVLHTHTDSEWETLMALLDQLPIGFFIWDLDALSFVHVNNYLCQILRVKDRASIENHRLTEFFDTEGDVFPCRISDDVPLTNIFHISFGEDKVQCVTTTVGVWKEGKHLAVGLMKKTNYVVSLSDNIIRLSVKDI